MADRKLMSASKITDGWKIQFPSDVRAHMDEKDGKTFKVGDRVAFYLESDGRIVIKRG